MSVLLHVPDEVNTSPESRETNLVVKMANIDSIEKNVTTDHIEKPSDRDILTPNQLRTQQITVDDAIVQQLENGEVVGFTWKTALGCIVC